jgi:cathepsin L
MAKVALNTILFAIVVGWMAEALPSVRDRPTAQSRILSFEAFVQLHSRAFLNGSAEYKARRTIYTQRLAAADAHNRQTDRLWTAGVNEFWDWTESELQGLRGWDGSAMPAAHSRSGVVSRRHASQQYSFLQRQREMPREKIWSGLSMARHVRNQGDCGSCWAIATATVLEGHAEIYTGKVRTFSPQQIVACTPNPRHCGGDGGCKGATAELAMDWVMKHGCADESQMPYQGGDDGNTKCPTDGDTLGTAASLIDAPAAYGAAAAFGMIGWETLPKNENEPLLRALAEKGPVAVSVAADRWFDYSAGVFDGCGQDAVIDHAVTAIGYGEEEGHKFWLIQNSWGQDWGEDGHIRLLRHGSGMNYCGMNRDPQQGVACKGETEAVPVCGMCGVLFDSVVPHFRKR